MLLEIEEGNQDSHMNYEKEGENIQNNQEIEEEHEGNL